MIALEVSIDSVAAKRFIDQLDGGDIAYATAQAMNRTMNEAQLAIRTREYSAVFQQRNKSLAKALTTIRNSDRASKRKLKTVMQNVRDGKTGRMAGEGFIERQVLGQSKIGRGQIAIPVLGRGLRRLAGGSIPKGQKPRGNKKYFRMGNVIAERRKTEKKPVVRFILQKTARPSRSGRFNYTDAGVDIIVRRLPVIWTQEVRRVIARLSLQSRGMGGGPRRSLP
jgi:ribosomal protein S8